MEVKDKEEKVTRRKHLKPSEVSEIIAIYELGEATQEELADRYGVAVSTIGALLSKHKITKGSKAAELRKEIEKQVFQDIVGDKEELLAKIADTKDDHYRWNEVIDKIAMNLLTQAMKNSQRVNTLKDDLRVLKDASFVLTNTLNNRYKILNITKHDEFDQNLEELPIAEMPPEVLEEVRNKQRMQYETIDDDALDDMLELEDAVEAELDVEEEVVIEIDGRSVDPDSVKDD